MGRFTPSQRSAIRAEVGLEPASDLTSALRAQLATAAQGAKADSALQDASAFATAAQGTLAATAAANAATALGWGDHAAAGYQAALGVGVYEQQAADGVDGGALGTGAWTLRTLTTEVQALTGATLAAGAVTVPAGSYLVFAEAPAYQVGAHRLALFVDGALTAHGVNARAPAAVDVATSSALATLLTVAAEAVLDLRHWVALAAAATDGGVPVTTGDAERYARLVIVKVG